MEALGRWGDPAASQAQVNAVRAEREKFLADNQEAVNKMQDARQKEAAAQQRLKEWQKKYNELQVSDPTKAEALRIMKNADPERLNLIPDR
jgi:hypothetical protein